MRIHPRKTAFTLAEVLIALALLGVLAAFTIPKVLTQVGHERDNAITKEILAALATTMEKNYLENRLIPGQTKLSEILDTTLNASRDTTSTIDVYQVPLTCAPPGRLCWRLANGAVVTTNNDQYYQPGANKGMALTIDPDGRNSGGSASNRQSLWVALYGDRKIATIGTLPRAFDINYVTGETYSVSPGSDTDPDWFHY